MDENGEFCYRYVQSPTNFIAANITCTRERAALVYIESSAENTRIMETYFTGRGGFEFWIGLNDLDREGTFKYNTSLSYSSFSA